MRHGAFRMTFFHVTSYRRMILFSQIANYAEPPSDLLYNVRRGLAIAQQEELRLHLGHCSRQTAAMSDRLDL